MLRLCESFLRAALWCTVVGGVAHAATAVAAEPPKANELVGTWTLDLTKESELKGSQDVPNQVTLVLEADTWKLTIVNEGGAQEVVGGYTLDAQQTPKLLDVTLRGDAESMEFFGIYEINRGKLTIGWRPDGARPADLTGTVADGLIEVTFVRMKME